MTDTDLMQMIDEKSIRYEKLGKRTTVCFAITNSGFELLGTSFCLDETKFNQKLGEQYALQNLLQNLESKRAYHLNEIKNMQQSLMDEMENLKDENLYCDDCFKKLKDEMDKRGI